MAKYRCLVSCYVYYEEDEIYDEDLMRGDYSIGELVRESPNYWELVEEDFVLPETWCVKVTEEALPYLIKYREKSKYKVVQNNPLFINIFNYMEYTGYGFYINEGYPEITLDQFKKYVLMEDNKEIIGYKLKEDFEQYRKVALTISDTITNWENSLKNYDISISQNGYINALKRAGVLDIWFEPIYKPKHTLPTINGYEGKIAEDMVV